MLFEKDFTFYGKHASYTKYLVENAKAFKRYIDVYMTAAALGALCKKRSEQSNSDDRARIYADAFNTERMKCNELFKVIILSDTFKEWSPEERANICFRYRGRADERAISPVTQEEVDLMKEAFDLFNSYVFGGIELLYGYFTTSSTTEIDDSVDSAYKTVSEQQTLIENRNNTYDDDQLFKPEF